MPRVGLYSTLITTFTSNPYFHFTYSYFIFLLDTFYRHCLFIFLHSYLLHFIYSYIYIYSYPLYNLLSVVTTLKRWLLKYVTISIFGSTSIPFPLYFAIHFPILFKSSFTISITKLFYFQPFYYSAFLLLSLLLLSLLLLSLSIIQPSIIQLFYYSTLLLSDISTSINTLDFHL